jgi:predicted PurR-regulated permease PerM
MDNTRLTRILLILLIVLAALFLAQMLWQLASGFADLLLLFLLGWLVAFVLNPVVFQLSEHPVPHTLIRALEPMLGAERARQWKMRRLSRGLVVVIIYLFLVLVVVVLVAMFAPTAITQLSVLARQMPEYMARAPEASGWIQDRLARFGLNLKVDDAVRAATAGLQGYAATLIQNALGIFTSLLSLLANLFFVLILGFIITLDGPRLRHRVLRVVPNSFNDEIEFLERSIDKTFGGFIRGQLIQSGLQLGATAIVMTIFGLDFVVIASLFAGLFMLIPLVGPFLALLPPLLVVVIESPGVTVWVLVILFAIQFVIVNVLMPRMMSEAVGLHPLLVFAAILFSVKIAGFWGAFFGIPVAGVLWAMGKFFFDEWRGVAQPVRTVTDDEMD